MICSKCGAELKEGCVFCSQCGQEAQIVSEIHVLEDDLLRKMFDEEDIQEKKTEPEQPADHSRLQENRKKNRKEEERRRKQKKALLTTVVLLIAVLIIVIIMIRHHQTHSAKYLLAKAESAYNQKEYTKAEKYLDQILNLDSQNQSALLMDGEIALAVKDYETAETRFLAVIALDPLCKQAYEGLIELYDAQGQTDKILSLMKDVTDESILALFEDFIVPLPEISVESGSFSEYFTVELTAPKNKLEIYYTLDGTVPTKEDTFYEDPVEISQQGTTVLTAVCMDADGNYSEPATAEYEVKLDAPDMPVVSPDGGQFSSPATVSVRVPEGMTAYYTWDGTTPDQNSAKYSKPMDIPEGNNILSVILIDENGMKSGVMKCNYIYYPETLQQGTSETGAVAGENG